MTWPAMSSGQSYGQFTGAPSVPGAWGSAPTVTTTSSFIMRPEVRPIIEQIFVAAPPPPAGSDGAVLDTLKKLSSRIVDGSEHGQQLEDVLRSKESTNPLFVFLNPGPESDYYQWLKLTSVYQRLISAPPGPSHFTAASQCHMILRPLHFTTSPHLQAYVQQLQHILNTTPFASVELPGTASPVVAQLGGANTPPPLKQSSGPAQSSMPAATNPLTSPLHQPKFLGQSMNAPMQHLNNQALHQPQFPHMNQYPQPMMQYQLASPFPNQPLSSRIVQSNSNAPYPPPPYPLQGGVYPSYAMPQHSMTLSHGGFPSGPQNPMHSGDSVPKPLSQASNDPFELPSGTLELPQQDIAHISSMISSLDGSRTSIKESKEWIISRAGFAVALVNQVQRTLLAEVDSTKRLYTLYLINDVLHHADPEAEQIKIAIISGLELLLALVDKNQDAETMKRISKVVGLWRERKIVPEHTIDSLERNLEQWRSNPNLRPSLHSHLHAVPPSTTFPTYSHQMIAGQPGIISPTMGMPYSQVPHQIAQHPDPNVTVPLGLVVDYILAHGERPPYTGIGMCLCDCETLKVDPALLRPPGPPNPSVLNAYSQFKIALEQR